MIDYRISSKRLDRAVQKAKTDGDAGNSGIPRSQRVIDGIA
jgi:hypothetical protein